MEIQDFEFDRKKVLDWWTGRISNRELAILTDQTERDVRFILSGKYFKNQTSGGGRGSKTTRRISSQARNSIGLVAALRATGLTIELSTAIIEATPIIASTPTEVIDFSPSVLEWQQEYGGVAMLAIDDPGGGWTPFDIVPRHVFSRMCRPVVKKGAPDRVSIGDIGWLPDWKEKQLGRIPDSARSFGEPMYRPEIDPMGIYDFGNKAPDNLDRLDSHFLIVDGRWVYSKFQHISPREYALDIFQHAECDEKRRYNKDSEKLDFNFALMSEIQIDRKTVLSCYGDEEKVAQAAPFFKQPRTLLDVNSSLAIREMKRKAYGLIGPALPKGVPAKP